MADYDVEFGEETFDWLTRLPESWTNVKKLAALTKQIVSPLLAHQIDLIKKRLNYFDFRQQKYLIKFRENDIFK